MWSIVLLQLAPLLPPSPTLPAPDQDELDLLLTVSNQEAWPAEDLDSWRPKNDAENRQLAAALPQADLRTLRFIATAAAGCAADSPLGQALYRAGCQWLPEAEALACLLAPTAPTPEQAVALADLALRAERPAALRAAALGRLLEAGYGGAWPLAKQMLLSGTAVDDPAQPYATWPRSGRYELMKRLILLSLKELASTRGLSLPTFEPNASWQAQVDALTPLEAAVLEVLGQGVAAPMAADVLPAGARGEAMAALLQPLP